MIYAFVAFWVVLGLSVFFVAMRGGPRAARESLHTESKLGQRAVVFAVVLAFAFGLVVPVLVLADNGANKASAGVGGVHLNAEEQHGRLLFSDSCAVCHTLAGANAEGHVGPNLDIRLGSEIPTEAGRRALVLNAIAEGRARGLGQMPPMLYEGHDAESIADFVAAVAGH
ncbi:MAG TPA: c-type cytochrome [Solirubrobacteraceae bacterium]|nr:c-type cytochrome [Solirubrobacteraceae bacterium]